MFPTGGGGGWKIGVHWPNQALTWLAPLPGAVPPPPPTCPPPPKRLKLAPPLGLSSFYCERSEQKIFLALLPEDKHFRVVNHTHEGACLWPKGGGGHGPVASLVTPLCWIHQRISWCTLSDYPVTATAYTIPQFVACYNSSHEMIQRRPLTPVETATNLPTSTG